MGPILGYISERGLQELQLPGPAARRVPLLHSAPNIVLGRRLARLLDRYFAGIAVTFDDVPLDIVAGTDFQRTVWSAARGIPWGKTITYGELARRVRKPAAARAVGQALGANPVPILVPCHRILAAGGGLGGFGAGLDWKRELLRTERCEL